MNQPRVPIRVAAKRTGLTVECIRAWERRYRAVEPERLRGARLFSERDINRLSLLKRAVDAGHNISQVANLSDADLNGLSGNLRTFRRDTQTRNQISAVLEQVLEHVTTYDALAADQEMGRLAAFLSPRQFCYEVMIPLMRLVGKGWEAGKITVAQEHLVSSLLRGLIATQLRRHLPVGTGTRVIIASPEGERHEFGMLCAAILALSAGMYPVYLGPELPVEDMIHAVRHGQADILVLGLTPNKKLDRKLFLYMEKLSQALLHKCHLMVGGGPNDAGTVKAMKALGIAYPNDFQSFETVLMDMAQKKPGQEDAS